MLKTKHLPFEVSQDLKKLGRHIRVARIRRRMTQDELSSKSGIARKTLYNIETGESGVAIGQVFSVLWALGLLNDIERVANPDLDEHGKILEAARAKRRVREPKVLDNDF